jgi:hypothetical protein
MDNPPQRCRYAHFCSFERARQCLQQDGHATSPESGLRHFPLSLGINPDLRHSGMLNSSEAIDAIVVDGALRHDGMVSFRTAIDRNGAEAIRQYLIKRANDDKTNGEAN